MNRYIVPFRKVGFLFLFSLFLLPTLLFAIDIPTMDIPKAAKTVKMPTLKLQDITIIDHGDKLSWYADTKNLGQTIAKNQLEISGYQIIGHKIIAKAGEKLIWNRKFNANGIIKFTRQNWARAKGATALKIVIKNRSNNQVVSKIVSLPKTNSNMPTSNTTTTLQNLSADHADALTKTPKLKVIDSRYNGRGAFQVKLKNVGERGFVQGEIEIRPIYHIYKKLPVVGKVINNQSSINVGKYKTVFSHYPNIYSNGIADCCTYHNGLYYIVLEIENRATGERTEHKILMDEPKGEIVDVDMQNSRLTYYVRNTGSFTTKYNIITKSFWIYKWYTDSNNQPNYDSDDKITQPKNLFKTTITLNPGEVGSVEINRQRVNAEIKQQFTNIKRDDAYGAAHFSIELYTKPNDICSLGKVYDQRRFEMTRSHSGYEIVTDK